MNHGSIPRRIALVALGAALLGCQELTVDNNNSPDRERATHTPDGVESLIASSFRRWWPLVHGTTPTMSMSAMADEFTSGFTDFSTQELSIEPRVAYNNSPVYNNSETTEDPWFDIYSALSLANAGLSAIDSGMQIGPDGANNSRALAFGRLMQGVSTGYLGLYFDKAAIVDEHVDIDTLVTPDYRPYPEVMAAAIGMLRASIAIADTAHFTTPTVGWIPGRALSNEQLSRLAHTYVARFMVYGARSAEERAAVDWNEVIANIDSGITEDFAPVGEPDILEDTYKQFIARQRTTTPSDFARADYFLVGPADSTDGFVNWVATPVAQRVPFQLRTKDRRIQGDTVGSQGKYFGYHGATIFNISRGTYNRSFYAFFRLGRGESWRSGPLLAITVTEMNLLKAEGLIRLGRAAEALPLINASRVANGELPPVTIDGPPDEPGCVPRKLNGACGSLWDALRYEKRIEGAGVDGTVAFFDARGWQALVENTPIHFPIPGRELETVRLPLYTTGGGQPGSAPAPAPESCPVALPRCS